jgi:aspartyl-tRNA synthetase
MEMSFVDTDDVLNMVEGLISHIFKDCMNVEIPTPLPRYTYRECMERFGSDKPDLRFGMEIVNLTDSLKGCEFPVFADAIAAGGSVRAINLKGYAEKLSRKEIDKLGEYAKGCGAKGMAWLKRADTDSGSILKHMSEADLDAIYTATDCEKGDILLILADSDNNRVLTQLGQLRVEAANRLGVERSGYNFLGWSTSSTATSATYSAGGSYTANAGATLYAVWEKANYEFSISNLTVSDSEPYRYGEITVKVRTDSWDQKNP